MAVCLTPPPLRLRSLMGFGSFTLGLLAGQFNYNPYPSLDRGSRERICSLGHHLQLTGFDLMKMHGIFCDNGRGHIAKLNLRSKLLPTLSVLIDDNIYSEFKLAFTLNYYKDILQKLMQSTYYRFNIFHWL